MSDDSDCCGACCGICCLIGCESILVRLNFKTRGSGGAGSTQRGCCRNWGESTEDDVFEQAARRQRVAADSAKNFIQTGDGNGNLKEGGGGGDGEPVTEQPVTSPVMTETTAATKPDPDEVK